jgi:hypothetical protein
MLKIQCYNEKCTAPDRMFSWKELPNLPAEGKLEQEEDEGPVSFTEKFNYHGAKNKVRMMAIREISLPRIKGRTILE